MSSHRIEIEKRLGKRKQAEEDWQDTRVPNMLSKASQSAFQKTLTTLREEYLDNCLIETHDMGVLLRTLNIIEQRHQIDVNAIVTEAWNERRLPHSIQQEMHEREHAEAEKREKAAKSDKKQGELEGQLKLKLNDDGSEAEGGDVTVKKMPTELGDLQEAIYAMQEQLQMTDEDLNTRFSAAGFSNTKSEDEQLAAHQTVWIELNNIMIEADLQLGSMAEATEEPAAEEQKAGLIDTIRTARGLVADDLLIQIADLVAQDLAGDAETILHHHYANVCGIEDDALITEYVALVIASSDDLPSEPTPEDGEETLNELIAANLKRAEELNISMDDLDQLYKDAAYDPEATLSECRNAAETVQRRLAAMKPVKKRGASKKKTTKAAEVAEAEDLATADLIG